MEAIEKAIDDYGKVGFIIISGTPTYEANYEFSDWRNKLKGGLSKNQIENISKKKKHRRLKTDFKPESIIVITIDNETIKKHLIVSGFHQPDGKIRRDKLAINLDKLSEEELLFNELLDE